MGIQHRWQLPHLMKKLGLPMIAVEVGVAEFNFSRDLLNEGIETLYSVDAWQTLNQKGDGGFEQKWHDQNYRQTLEKSKPFGDRSIILRGLSTFMSYEVPDNSLGLLYLDGDHSYSGVTKDLRSWYKKVVIGGIICTHDYLSPQYGTKKAFVEWCGTEDEITIIPETNPENASAYFIKK